MADIVSNLLTYTEYLSTTEQTSAEVSEIKISILSMQQVINSRLLCLGISDITTLTPDALAVLKNWSILYISYKLSNEVKTSVAAQGNTVLTEIDDGFVKESYEQVSSDTGGSTGALNQLDELWHLFMSLVPQTASTDSANGLGVAKRTKKEVCAVLGQNTL